MKMMKITFMDREKKVQEKDDGEIVPMIVISRIPDTRNTNDSSNSNCRINVQIALLFHKVKSNTF